MSSSVVVTLGLLAQVCHSCVQKSSTASSTCHSLISDVSPTYALNVHACGMVVTVCRDCESRSPVTTDELDTFCRLACTVDRFSIHSHLVYSFRGPLFFRPLIPSLSVDVDDVRRNPLALLALYFRAHVGTLPKLFQGGGGGGDRRAPLECPSRRCLTASEAKFEAAPPQSY